jgi:hypothetical protein
MNDFVKELCYIKNVQREFNNKFGKKLVVDIPATKGISHVNFFSDDGEGKDEMLNYLNRLLKYYSVDLEDIRSKKNFRKSSLEMEVVRAFCCAVSKNGWNQTVAGKLINRDRSSFRYFSEAGVNRRKSTTCESKNPNA